MFSVGSRVPLVHANPARLLPVSLELCAELHCGVATLPTPRSVKNWEVHDEQASSFAVRHRKVGPQQGNYLTMCLCICRATYDALNWTHAEAITPERLHRVVLPCVDHSQARGRSTLSTDTLAAEAAAQGSLMFEVDTKGQTVLTR